MSDYDYSLPAEQVALQPLAERSGSRLLRVDVTRGTYSHRAFTDLADDVPAGSLLLVNASRVIPARLAVTKSTGGAAEVLLLQPLVPHAVALAAHERTAWSAMIGGKKIGAGDVLSGPEGLRIRVLHKNGAEAEVELTWTTGVSFSELLEQIGRIPLPPYLHRDDAPLDRERYQTVYARDAGSVAAPTAGLHFTDEVLRKLSSRAQIEQLYLHVGAGTFKPVDADDARFHSMHAETISISVSTLEALARVARARDEGSSARVIAVGTTSLRTLESVAICGARILRGGHLLEKGYVARQWDGREWSKASDADLFLAVANALRQQGLGALQGLTDLMIAPGYPALHVDRLITNFHQPRSTLLLLVAAFSQGGDLWKRAYGAAIREGYRLLSYGDSSIWIRR